jgi:hypothetical protein
VTRSGRRHRIGNAHVLAVPDTLDPERLAVIHAMPTAYTRRRT